VEIFLRLSGRSVVLQVPLGSPHFALDVRLIAHRHGSHALELGPRAIQLLLGASEQLLSAGEAFVGALEYGWGGCSHGSCQLIQTHLARDQPSFSFVEVSLALIRGPLALVGDMVALVGDMVALVRRPVALVDSSLALVAGSLELVGGRLLSRAQLIHDQLRLRPGGRPAEAGTRPRTVTMAAPAPFRHTVDVISIARLMRRLVRPL
jgi:hypothetical protein